MFKVYKIDVLYVQLRQGRCTLINADVLLFVYDNIDVRSVGRLVIVGVGFVLYAGFVLVHTVLYLSRFERKVTPHERDGRCGR